MKRFRTYPALLALLLTAALTGCRRESQPQSGDGIHFSVSQPVSVELETKALPKPDIPTIDEIKVWADKKIGEGSWTQVFENQPQTATLTTEDIWDYWGAGIPVRWTPGASYRFRSVYPAATVVQSGSGSDKLDINYSMHDSDLDLMVAAKNLASKPEDSIVPLQFHHATAAVCFRFQTATGNTYLTRFELQNLYTTGTLSYTGTGENGVSESEWTRHGVRAQQVYPWAGSTSGSFVFVVDLTDGSEKVTVSTSGDAPADNEDATIWIEYGDGLRKGLTPDSPEPDNKIYRVKVEDFDSSWGFHFMIGNRIWGGDGTLLNLDSGYPIVKNAADIDFAYADGLTQDFWQVPSSQAAFGGWHYVIPQELNAGDGLNPAVSFTYAIGQMAISETLDLPVVSGNDGIKWEAGKVYVYSVQIQPESAISVSVEDWDSFYVSTDDVIFTD